MGPSESPKCINYPIFLWQKGSATWREYGRNDPAATDRAHDKPCFHMRVADEIKSADVAVILAHADAAREHKPCHDTLSADFQIPQLWWTQYCRSSNGYFGCETQTDEEGNLTGMTSWVRFIVKVCGGKLNYSWYKINMFVNWDGSLGKTVIFVFDPPDDLKSMLPSIILQDLRPQTLMDPFWVYPSVLENIVSVQDKAVWLTRTHIRMKEKERDTENTRNPNGKPKPNYAELHDLARHAIHGIETLELAVKTAQTMMLQHSSFKDTFDASPVKQTAAFSATYHRVQERLQFFEHVLDSLRHRASSNKQRLSNEIQLVFNSVAQYDAGLSLQISHATRSDSSAMRTIAFLTLTFLPATFIAAVFSMSFFNYEVESGWNMASEFWLYWAIAIPVTILTAVSWLWWRHYDTTRSRERLFADSKDEYEPKYVDTFDVVGDRVQAA